METEIGGWIFHPSYAEALFDLADWDLIVKAS